MNFIDKFKTVFVAQRKTEESLYSTVASEMASGIKNEALWLKALELAKGNKERQISEYIKLRVQALKDDIHIVNNYQEPNNLIEHKLEIEEFISMIDHGAAVGKIEMYFSGVSIENICIFLNSKDACDDYPIHVAVKKNQLEIIEWLLQNGANSNVKDSWDETPLEIAIRREDSEAQTVIAKNLA